MEQHANVISNSNDKTDKSAESHETNQGETQGEAYWRMRFERLQTDYDHLQSVNQNLEERLLNVVEETQKKLESVRNVFERDKSTLMNDVNKLSTKLVDARIKLHDFEEKEQLHAAGCDSPCHKGGPMTDSKKNNGSIATMQDQTQMINDPNLV